MIRRIYSISLLLVLGAVPAFGQTVAGLEVLLTEQQALVAGKRVGLITNHTGVDRQMNHAIDLIRKAPGTRLTALFAPEHGIRGLVQAGGKVADTVDERSGVRVYSLYGAVHRPTPEMLAEVDVLVYDIQDVGARFYTFISTMGEGMDAAAEKGIPFIVLDRPNPLADIRVEGRVMDMNYKSFVGAYPIPARFGMTPGELAGFYRDRMEKKVDLKVVKMKNWKRSTWYDQTGLAWIPPSPNIPTLTAAIVYPGTCLIEGTNVSEGRGTTTPFEVIGAPWIDGYKLADELRKANLPGVLFRPAGFTPTFSKYQGEVCQGVQLHVVDRDRFEPVRTALHLLKALKQLWPDKFQWRSSLDRLSGSDDVRRALDRGDTPEQIVESWSAALKEYEEVRRRYFLYD
ncbi:MAG: exo-beta-N-acetylmuramidase NamZ domain-containing protein [Thermoguttaceae bacterium]|jgi:uncharacterized protein YbbC (DUF1343 family)